MIEFGDDAGADDAFDASGAAIDPAAVAVRFHDSRVMAGLAGTSGYWHRITDDERAIANWLAVGIVDRLNEGQRAREISKWLRRMREYLSGVAVPYDEHWRERRLIRELIESLEREGTL